MWSNSLQISLLLVLYIGACRSLILTSPRDVLTALNQPSALGVDYSAKIASAVKIRSTHEDDIDEISAILAAEAFVPSGSSWMGSINHLRRVASFQSLLSQRHQVMKEGHKALSRVLQDYEGVSDADQLRLVWNHDAFRSRLRRAAAVSTEPHLWKEHNFALCPTDISHLQHLMVTAKAEDGTIVGFCEVAMLEAPDGSSYSPTIANLVINEDYRRQGIGQSLLESVTRYVQQNWNAEELALYVAKDNEGAVSLYQKAGFQWQRDDEDKWYMTKQLSRVSERVAERALQLA